MKNPRIVFGAAILMLSILLMAILVVMKPRKPNVVPPEWNAVFDFIQTADKVETIATTYDAFEYEKPPSDPAAALTKYDPLGHHLVKDVPISDRTELTKILQKLPDVNLDAAACFCPHHYIIATKEAKKVVVSMCYFCGGINVSGAIKLGSSMRKDTQNEVSKFFGLDVFPFLEERKGCSNNSGTYDPGLAEKGVNGPH